MVINDNGGAGLRQPLCRGRADTSARPCDESHFPSQRLESRVLRH
jgi:hypothetical protein